MRYSAYAKPISSAAVIAGGLLFSTTACNSIGRYSMHNGQSIQAASPKTIANVMVNQDDCIALGQAVINGNVEAVQRLLQKPGMPVNILVENGFSLLHYAAAAGHIEVVKALLRVENISVNEVDKVGWTTLHHAASGGHREVVGTLLGTTDIRINEKDKFGCSPLYYASSKLVALRHVLYMKEKVMRVSQAERACLQKYSEVIKMLKKAIRDNRESEVMEMLKKVTGANGESEVMEMLEKDIRDNGKCKSEVIEIFKKDIRDNGKSEQMYTSSAPYFWISKQVHIELVEALIQEKGIQVNVEDQERFHSFPLHWAAEKGHVEIVETLLKTEYILVSQADLQGKTPLDLARENNHDACVSALENFSPKFLQGV